MTPSQTRKLEYAKKHIESTLSKNPEHGDVVKFEVKEHADIGMVFLSASTKMEGLPEGNLLRCVSATHWLVFIGKNGGLTLKMGPDSYKQFNGRKAFGFNVEMSK